MKPGHHQAAGQSRARPILPTGRAAFRWGVLIALAAQLLFAHGCHGDEDHELLDAAVAWFTTREP